MHSRKVWVTFRRRGLQTLTLQTLLTRKERDHMLGPWFVSFRIPRPWKPCPNKEVPPSGKHLYRTENSPCNNYIIYRSKEKKTNITLFFIYMDVVFSGQAEYSYFSADFSLKIFLYSWIIIEKERIYHKLYFLRFVHFSFLTVYYRYVFHVPFIELSLAMNIWL